MPLASRLWMAGLLSPEAQMCATFSGEPELPCSKANPLQQGKPGRERERIVEPATGRISARRLAEFGRARVDDIPFHRPLDGHVNRLSTELLGLPDHRDSCCRIPRAVVYDPA